jgi:hypothetical protein
MQRRESVRKQYPELFGKLEEIFFRYDPVGINFGSNPDEYASEVAVVLEKLPMVHSQEALRELIYETFCNWFDTQLAGNSARRVYHAMAEESWKAWCEEWEIQEEAEK